MKKLKLLILVLVYSSVFFYQINQPVRDIGLPLNLSSQKSTEQFASIDHNNWQPLEYNKSIRKDTWVKIKVKSEHSTLQSSQDNKMILSFYRRSVWDAVVYMPPEYNPIKVSIFSSANTPALNKYITVPLTQAALNGDNIYIQSNLGSISGFLKVSSSVALINYESAVSTILDMGRGIKVVGFLLGIMLFVTLKDRLYGWFSLYVLSTFFFIEVRIGSIFDSAFGELLSLYGANISGISIGLISIIALIFFPMLSRCDIYAPKLEKSRKIILGVLSIFLLSRLLGADIYRNFLMYSNLLYLAVMIQLIASCSVAAYHKSYYALHALGGLSFLIPVSAYQALGALQLVAENNFEYVHWSVSIVLVTLFFLLSLTHKALSFKQERDQALTIALIDRLTGIKNRRAMNDDLEIISSEMQRGMTTFYFVMLDIDHFKNVNDTYGHLNGDMCLKNMVSSVQEVLREGDLFYRYGGEEFLLILKCDDKKTIHTIAERIRSKVASIQINLDGSILQFTVSLGVAHAASNSNVQQAIKAADTALYHSKKTGINKVSFADE